MNKIAILGLTLILGACAITHETTLLVGEKRAEISPEEVKLYTTAPANYEEIAIVSADTAHDFMSKQALQDLAIEKLKAEAAKVGANGIILDNVGSFNVGGSGVVVVPQANGVNPVGTIAVNNRTGKQATGKAIYVPK